MCTLISEDHHDSNQKGKPRSPRSQGDILKSLIADDSVFDSSDDESDEDSTGNIGSDTLTPKPPIPNILSRSKALDIKLKKKEQEAGASIPVRLTSPPRSSSFSRYLSGRWFRSDQKPRKNSMDSKSERVISTTQSTESSSRQSTETLLSIPSSLNVSIETATMKDYKRVAKTLLLAFEDDPFTNYILNTSQYKRETTPKSVYKKKKMDLMLAYFELSSYEILNLYGKIFVIKDKQFESILSEMDIKQKHKFPFLAVSCWHKIFGEKVDTYYSSITSSDDSDESDDFSDDDFFASEVLSLKHQVHPSQIKFNVFAFLNNCRSKVMKDKLPFLTKVRNDVLMNKLMRDAGTDAATPTIDIWYLADVATLPSMGGKGLGKLLINHVIEEHIMKESPKSYVYLESSNPMNRGFYTKLGFSVMASYSMKKKRYVDSDSVLKTDPHNKGVNMDAMVRYPKQT